MSHMQKLIVLRVLRPDKGGAKDFIVIITKGMVLAYSAVCEWPVKLFSQVWTSQQELTLVYIIADRTCESSTMGNKF